MSDAARALPEAESALPPGTRLAEFEIRSLLGVGGFGIVYLAFDHALEREVAIKEYMPASMAGRTETLHVSLRSQSDAEVFALGLRSFVNEAKLLARFDHPSLIKVHRFWEANGTAYMAMPVLRGRTLKDIRRSTGRAPDEPWIRHVLAPLLGALEQLHNEGVFHRDIAPDNIHLEGDGGASRPVLLDFGAARRVISGKTQTLTAILKPAYAPIEQYAETGAVKQGPWTDLYALGATLHFMLLGHPPAPATARTVADEASGLAAMALPGCSRALLATIDWMLAPRPTQRPQSVAELQAVLDGRAPLPPRAQESQPMPAVASAGRPPGAMAPAAGAKALPPQMPALSPVTVPLGDIAPADIEFDIGTLPPPRPAASGQTTRLRPGAAAAHEALSLAADARHRVTPPQERSRLWPLALAAVVVAAGGLGYFGWTRLGPSQAVPGAAAASAAAGATDAPGTAGPAGTTAVATPGIVPASTAPESPGSAAAPSGTAAGATTAAGSGAGTAPTPAPAPRAEAPAPRPEPPAPRPPARPAAPPAAAPRPAAGATPAPVPADAQSGTAAAPAPAGATPATAAAPTPATAPTAAPARPAAPAAAPPAAAEPPLVAPSVACAGRNVLSHYVCMERECLKPRLWNHPDCQAWRQQARPRELAPN